MTSFIVLLLAIATMTYGKIDLYDMTSCLGVK